MERLLSLRSDHHDGDSSFAWSAAVFCAVILAWRRSQRRQHGDKDLLFSEMIPRHQRFSVRYADRKREKGQVGPRGQVAMAPPVSYLNLFLDCLNDPCHVENNPRGYIALCVAENKLVLDVIAERFMQAGSTGFADSSVYTYNSMLGMPVAREAAAYFLQRRFYKRHREEASTHHAANSSDAATLPQLAINPKCIGLGTGGAALINHIFFLLGSAGDCCLIPKPYYAAFENDMNLIAGIVPFGVTQANPAQGPTMDELQVAYIEAQAKGLNPKFVLLTNPNNPLGTIYAPSVVQHVTDWAATQPNDVHVICDELYALSTHKEDSGFESVISILDNELGTNVHMIWAISKDFACSGLRFGLLYSQNEALMEGLATMSIFTCVSGPIQYLVAELLTDNAFCDYFLQESRTRLVASYQLCVSKLQEMVLPYVPAQAGLFVYVDFSSLLPERTFAWERQLCQLFFDEARIVLTPGESQREHEAGMFRICYAWVSPDILQVAMERLSRLVAKLRRRGLEEWASGDDGTVRKYGAGILN